MLKIETKTSRISLFHTKIRVCLSYSVNHFPRNQLFASRLPQTPFKPDFNHTFCNSKAFLTVLT